MVSLKQTKAEHKKAMQGPHSPGEPAYPWGTCLRFDSKRLIEKLGLNELKAGDEVRLHAKAKVARLATTATDKGDDYTEMELQVTDLEVMDTNGYDEGFKEA
jgi:hypothetical protein